MQQQIKLPADVRQLFIDIPYDLGHGPPTQYMIVLRPVAGLFTYKGKEGFFQRNGQPPANCLERERINSAALCISIHGIHFQSEHNNMLLCGWRIIKQRRKSGR